MVLLDVPCWPSSSPLRLGDRHRSSRGTSLPLSEGEDTDRHLDPRQSQQDFEEMPKDRFGSVSLLPANSRRKYFCCSCCSSVRTEIAKEEPLCPPVSENHVFP